MPIPTVDQLESLIGQGLGAAARVERAEHLAPWSVMRCTVRSEAAGPVSLIVKWLREDHPGLRVDLRRVATERAALEFLAAIGFASAPRLIGADLEAGVLLLQDLLPCEPLADQLRRQGAAASREGLLGFARVTGRLSAATAGRSGAYDAIRARYGEADPLTGRAMGLGAGWARTARLMDDFGLGMPAAVEAELAGAAETLLEPGPFVAFSNGDPEANNCMVGEAGAWLIDFETAAFRHALTSATWIHVPGPMWITVAAADARADLEQTYRSALAEVVSEAEDDRLFGQAMAAACLAMAFERLGRAPVLERRPAGDASRVQMVATLEAAAGAARRHGALADLAGWTRRVAEGLRARWPDTDVDLAAYAPYTPRA